MKNRFSLKKFFKILIINISILLALFLLSESIFIVLETYRDTDYEYKLKNKNFDEKTPRIPLKVFIKNMLFLADIEYRYNTNNNYFQLCEFRKPSVGKNYKNKDIIIAGCSFAHGACVGDNETISAVIAQKFPKYKVYNIGLCGGSPRETLYILRNAKNFANLGILPSAAENTEHVVFIYIPDHKRRLIISSLRTDSPHFKVVKSKNGEKDLKFYIPFNNIRKTFTYKYLTYGLKLPDIVSYYLDDLLILYFKEINKEIKTNFPKADFSIFVFSKDFDEKVITSLNEIGVKIIFSDKNYENEKYVAFDKAHPNKRAWEEITDYLGKELNF